MELILASASPRRQELLHLITSRFTVLPADIDETLPPELPADHAAQYLAQLKAGITAMQVPDQLVIGCDTTVVLDQLILGKPKSEADAVQMLQQLSGCTHRVITGVALAHGLQMRSFQVETQVTFYPLTEAEIHAYIQTGESFDKAGAYGIQGKGALLVSEIQGDYFNVVGLPVAKLNQVLKEYEIAR